MPAAAAVLTPEMVAFGCKGLVTADTFGELVVLSTAEKVREAMVTAAEDLGAADGRHRSAAGRWCGEAVAGVSLPDPPQMTGEEKAALDGLRADFPAWAFGLQHRNSGAYWNTRPASLRPRGVFIRIETDSAGFLREALEAVEEIDARHAKAGGLRRGLPTLV